MEDKDQKEACETVISEAEEYKEKSKTHRLVVTKDNQIALRHNKYGVNYLIELDAESAPGQVTVHYTFDPTVELTEAQKQEIVDETRELITETFYGVTDETDLG